MAAKATTIPPLFSTPYLTVAEYTQAPTGIDTSNLSPGNPAASPAELANMIARASSWVDNYCGQVLAATVDTENVRTRPSRDGTLHIHPRYTPILEVLSVAYGGSPDRQISLSDLSGLWVETSEFHVPLQEGWTTRGPLQFGGPVPGRDLYVSYSYVNGYPNTTLAATALAGATSITVADGTGMLAGLTRLGVYDGPNSETVQVAATYTGGTVLPLVSPLTFAHATVGVSVSALPPAVKQATILITTALVKTRGAAAVVMPSFRSQQPRQQTKSEFGADLDMEYALDLLEPYRRVR